MAGAVPSGDIEARRIRSAVAIGLFGDPDDVLRVGRYEVQRELGHGGLGVVYRAHDPQLGRDVAIKVTRRGEASHRGEADREMARMLREATSQARIAHPHVVPVYDVGMVDGELYIAMELIEGLTLKEWLVQRRPSWREILRVFIEAGRGLVAAHAVGLVHRDFKPHNVMVGDDGRARVLDFGLAKHWDDPSWPDTQASDPSGSVRRSSSFSTATGTWAGTPAYMAPEQFRGDVGPTSDQFSFCVSLYEALHGTRPPQASSRGGPSIVHGLAMARSSGRHTAVPRRIDAAVHRGLQREPSRRWPSMEALVGELETALSPKRRRLVTAVWFGVLALGVAAWQGGAENEEEPCEAAQRQLDGIWDEQRREQTRTAVLASDVPAADEVWSQAERELDDYARGWVAMHVEVCEANRSGEQSNEDMDLTVACLRRARSTLIAVTGAFLEASPNVVRKAHEFVATMEPLAHCADLEALRQDVPPPLAKEAQRVEAVRLLIDEGKVEADAGDDEAAAALARKARELLEGVEYGPIQTDVLLLESEALMGMGRYVEAEAKLEETLRVAWSRGQRRQMQVAAIQLTYVVGYAQQKTQGALEHRELMLRLAEGFPREQAHVHNTIGLVLTVQGRSAEAEDEFRIALSRYEEVLGPEAPETARAADDIGNALADQGKHQDALGYHRRALATRESVLGRDHLEVAMSRNNLARVLQRLDEPGQSELEYREALRVFELNLGADHPHVAATHNNLSVLLLSLNEFDAALREAKVALAGLEKALGADHPRTAIARSMIALSLKELGRLDEAESQIRASVKTVERAFGDKHPLMASVLNDLALILHAQGRLAESETEFTRTLAIAEAALAPEHPDIEQYRSNFEALRSDQARAQSAAKQE